MSSCLHFDGLVKEQAVRVINKILVRESNTVFSPSVFSATQVLMCALDSSAALLKSSSSISAW